MRRRWRDRRWTRAKTGASPVDLVVKHGLGHEGAGLDIAASFELEEISFGADDWPPREPVEKRIARYRHCFLPFVAAELPRIWSNGWHKAPGC